MLILAVGNMKFLGVARWGFTFLVIFELFIWGRYGRFRSSNLCWVKLLENELSTCNGFILTLIFYCQTSD